MESIPERTSPILIVDDDTGFLLTIKAILKKAGMPEPALVSDSRRIMELLEAHPFQFVLLDLIMPHIDGLDLLRQIKSKFYDLECVIVTASDDISSAVKAMKIGAYDYLTKPISSEKLVITIRRAMEKYCLRFGLALYERTQTTAGLKNPAAFDDIIAEDEKMARVLHQVEIVSPTDYSVVISGESGTGKERIARKIHQLSARSKGPFVAVNMGALSETLFQDELFGHRKGAYTGADRDKIGFFESAQGGTLFLDEITDLGTGLQGGLLRVIQEKEYYPIGSTRSRATDVRILAATNRDIGTEITEGRFRADLFHRLNMFHIHIPPLRERRKDILPLTRYFLNSYSKETGKKITSLNKEVGNALLMHPFSGNVRELENMIASAVLLEQTQTLTSQSLPQLMSAAAAESGGEKELLSLSAMEKQHILRVLSMVDGNRTRAAKALGIGRKTLQRKLKAYGSS